MSLKLLYSWFKRKLGLVSLKTLFTDKQRPLSQIKRIYYKNHDRRNFYSTLCQIAKRNQCYNLIQSTQNDSISVEHNSKTLAQNKFNTRQPIQNLTCHVLPPNRIAFTRLEYLLRLSFRASRVVSNYLFLVYFVSLSWSSLPLSSVFCNRASIYCIRI